MTDIFPPEQRARMSGVFGAIFGLSSVLGPSLGGFLTDGPGWRSVFYVNIPLGVAATILVATQLPRVRSQARLRDIDFAGTALLLAGLTPLLISLSTLRDHSWLSVQVLGLLGLAAVLLVAFFVTERRVEHPIIPFGLFRLNVFAVPALIAFFSAIGMFGAIVFVPLVYQGVLGVSASNAGQLLTPMQLAVVVTATATGVLLARVPRYRFVGTAALGAMILCLLAGVGGVAPPLVGVLRAGGAAEEGATAPPGANRGGGRRVPIQQGGAPRAPPPTTTWSTARTGPPGTTRGAGASKPDGTSTRRSWMRSLRKGSSFSAALSARAMVTTTCSASRRVAKRRSGPDSPPTLWRVAS